MRHGGLPVLTYHAIDRGGGVTSTDPSWFAETLDALVASGYRGVDLDDWIAQGRPAVDRGFALTFDDGLESILEIADVVAGHRIPATVFLVSDRVGIDNDWPGQPPGIERARLLDWSAIEALHAKGFRFGAHGRTHARLDRLDGESLEDEIRGSREAIEDRLGAPCRLFAYPYGVAPRHVRLEASRHFAASFGTRLDLVNAAQEAHHLSRIDAYYLRSRRGLDRLISGRWQAWLRMRRALRSARAVCGQLALGRYNLGAYRLPAQSRGAGVPHLPGERRMRLVGGALLPRIRGRIELAGQECPTYRGNPANGR